MLCPKCNGDMIVQAVSETNKRGCFGTLFLIILLFIPILGWIALFMIIRGRKSKTNTIAVCQHCGYSFYV